MNIQFRKGPLAPALAAAGGLAYAVEGAIVVRAPQPDHHWHASGYAVEAAFIAALVATLPLPPFFQAAAGRVGVLASRVVQLGFAAMLVSAVASLAAGETTLGPLFLLGVLAGVVGLLALTIGAIRRRTTGWWASPLAFVGLVASIALGDHGGGILMGLAWIAISIGFRERVDAVLPTVARV